MKYSTFRDPMRNLIAIMILGLTASSWAQNNVVDFRNSPDVPFRTTADRYVYLNEFGDYRNRLVGVNHRYTVERTTNTVDWEPVFGATDVLGTGDIVMIVARGAGCQVMRAYRARLMD